MDILSAQELNKRLTTKSMGRHAVILDTIDSTNTEARRMLEKTCADGTVLIANSQTGGRGRRGRHWVSEDGCGLWMTVVVKPFMPLEELQKVTLLAGLAVCGAVEQETDGAVQPVIKWPNDVLANGRKLCGILCESANDGQGERHVLIGIGVNTKMPQVGWGEAADVATSLEQVAGMVVPRLQLAASILNNIEELMDLWKSAGFDKIAEGYRHYMLSVGSDAVVIDGGQRRQGRIEGLDDGGGLLVRLENGEVERIIS